MDRLSQLGGDPGRSTVAVAVGQPGGSVCGLVRELKPAKVMQADLDSSLGWKEETLKSGSRSILKSYTIICVYV